MPTCQVNNVNFYYELYGNHHTKPALVLISGYTADHIMWAPMIEVLAENHQVLIFDNQGVGKTQDDGAALTVQAMAKNTFSLIEKLKLSSPTIVGYAMGSTIAQEVAIAHSSALSKLILINSVAKWSDFAIQQVEKLYKLRTNATIEKMLPLLYEMSFSTEFKSRYSLDEYIAIKRVGPPVQQTLENQYRQLQALIRFDSHERLDKIIVETVIIGCEQDILGTSQDSEYLKENILNSSLILLPYGHGIFFEAPEQLLNTLKNICSPTRGLQNANN